MTAYALCVNGRRRPLELDEQRPTLTWKHRGTGPAGPQTVWVDEHDAVSGTWTRVWSSECGQEERSISVPASWPLAPFGRYRWGVDAVDAAGEDLSAGSDFATGHLGTPWQASWIHRPHLREAVTPPAAQLIPRTFQTAYSAPPSQFRTTFDARKEIVSARLYISARGIYQASISGVRVGHDELTPGWTDYRRRIEYQAYDVTDLIAPGRVALAVTVADGWWSGYLGYNTRRHADQYGTRPELIAELHLVHADGTKEVVASDASWRESPGHIVMADLLMGEYHDHRFATEGWEDPGFDDSAWPRAEVSAVESGALSGQLADPVRVHSILPAQTLTHRDGAVIVDFGQNLVGRVRLTVRGQARDSVVTLRHGEMLHDGALYTENLRTAEARDSFVARGLRTETFEPAFTLHGFRYAEIGGLTGPLSPEDVTAVVLTSDNEPTGTFQVGSALVDRLQRNIAWGQRGNYLAVPTDCPQRDERLGWTADTQIFARTGAFNADIRAFLTRWLDDLAGAQDASGRVPDVVPNPPTSDNFSDGAPGWGDAAVIVPWILYEEYGDLGMLRRHYPMMRAWVEYVRRSNPDGLWTRNVGNNYGDWLSVDEITPPLLVAAAYQIRSVDLLALAAHHLSETEDERGYASLAGELRRRFAERFIQADGRVVGDTQTGYLMALAWGLAPDDRRLPLAERLVELIEQRGNRLTSGFLGINLLLPVLSSIGRDDLAVALLLQTDYPSWGYSIERGATTIWERWDGYTTERGFQDVAMNSFNHYSLGSVGEWLYRRVAGIDQAPGSVGYRTVEFAPLIAPELSPVQATFESPRGRIMAFWDADGRASIELPPDTTAIVRLPGTGTIVGPGRHEFTFPPLHAFRTERTPS
ncbi:alpha-L-rhamnosidase [Leifsonia aquatica]|uniref:alpha-L-rhamnosidase n=1 Tax=Leifsonia aquatica TaxID=144185 RepID=UPI0038098802